MNTNTRTGTIIQKPHIPQIQADPFTDLNQFDKEYAERQNAIYGLLAASTAILFKSDNFVLAFHPSIKRGGNYQITVFLNDMPFSDSQHDTIQEAARRIMEYNRLDVLEILEY